MVSESNQFDELPDDKSESLDDIQLEQFIKSAFAAPELSETFVNSLSRKLDREFANQYLSDDQTKQSHQHVTLNGSHRESESISSDSHSGIKASSPRRLSAKWRVAVTLAVAASLLVATTIWNSPPAYGWASMVRALEKCNWVQAVATSGSTNGWISSREGVLAVRTKGRAYFRNEQQNLSSLYLSEENAVRQHKTASGKSADWEANLLKLLMQGMTETHSFFDDFSLGVEIVKESWKSVEGENGSGKLIELRVTLKPAGEEGREFELIFLLDPETQLPLECRLGGEQSTEAQFYDFAYPEQGPTTIYALGVPAETQVIEATNEIALLAQAAPIEIEGIEVKQELAAAKAVKSIPQDKAISVSDTASRGSARKRSIGRATACRPD